MFIEVLGIAQTGTCFPRMSNYAQVIIARGLSPKRDIRLWTRRETVTGLPLPTPLPPIP
jgi:hypothetical protein